MRIELTFEQSGDVINKMLVEKFSELENLIKFLNQNFCVIFQPKASIILQLTFMLNYIQHL